jgi:hypothetical protein
MESGTIFLPLHLQCDLFFFFALLKTFDIKYDAPGGSAPAAMASPDCDCAVLPVRNRREISRLGNTEASRCAPAPNGGRVGARGDHHVKRGFLQSTFLISGSAGYIDREQPFTPDAIEEKVRGSSAKIVGRKGTAGGHKGCPLVL